MTLPVDNAMKTVSVVINTFNRRESLERALRSLEWLDYPNFEVVVVNGPSTDGTQDFLGGMRDRIKVGECANRNLSESRNIGIRMASGEIVAFMDDDAYPDPSWLDPLAEAFERVETAAAGGPVIDHTGYGYQVWHSRADRFGNWWDDFPPCVNPTDLLAFPYSRQFTYTIGTNSAFRRDILVQLGGFDEEFEYYLEETDLCCRITDAGFVVAALDTGFVYHKFLPSDIRDRHDVVKDWYQILKSRFYFGLKHGSRVSSYADVCSEQAKFVEKIRANVNLNFDAGVHDRATRDKFENDVTSAADRALQLFSSGRTKERPPEWFGAGETPFLRYHTRRPRRHKLHVCFLSQEYPPEPVNGIGRVVHALATGMAARGHVVRVLTRGKEHPRVDLEDDVWVHRVVSEESAPVPDGLGVPEHIWSYSATLLKELHRIEGLRPIDLVQGPNWDSEGVAVVAEGHFRYVVGLYTPLRSVLRSDPSMRHQAESSGDLFTQLIDTETYVYREAEGYLACGPAIVQEIEDEYRVSLSRNPLGLVPHGLADTSKGVSVENSSHRRVILLFVGRLEARKGIDTLLEAALLLNYSRADFELRIVGDDTLMASSGLTYRHEFERDHPELGDQVRFLGRVDDQALAEEYMACDIFVAPSRFESFGLNLLEAMMFGKPVVCADVGGMREIVENGVSGLLVPPENPSALAQVLIDLLGSSRRRAELGDRGRDVYQARFTLDRMAEDAESFYQRLVAHRDPHGTSARAREDNEVGLS